MGVSVCFHEPMLGMCGHVCAACCAWSCRVASRAVWTFSLGVFLFICSVQSFAQETTLTSLVQAALQHHPSLRGSQQRQDAAGSGLEAARWQFWPTPSVSVESVGANQDDPSYRGDASVSYLRLQQPLWTGGRLMGNLSRAEAKVAAAQAELLEAKQQLALRVTQAWSEALVAHLKLRAYEGSRSMHERLLELVRRRHAEGVSAQADVALASNRLSTVLAELEATKAQLNTARERLRLLTGRAVPSDFSAGSLPLRSANFEALLAEAREQSPSLMKARSAARVAEAEIDIARAAVSPEVYLRVERQYGSFLQAHQAPVSRAFVGVSTAFGGGLSSLSGVDAAIAQHRAALEDVQTQQLALDDQVQADYTLADTARTRREGLEAARLAAAEVLTSYERQFLAGRKQWQDLMNAAREQAQSELQLADAIGAQQLANWRLALLSQGVDALLVAAAAYNRSGTGARP